MPQLQTARITPSMARFGLATLTPAALIACGDLAGGGWVWAALAYMTLFTYAMDRVLALAGDAPAGKEFPAAEPLSVLLAFSHLLLLPLTVAALSTPETGSLPTRLALFLAAGLFFGQVSNSNAHELIHSRHRLPYRLGVLVYISLLFGHHASAHRLVHHRHVATPEDPNSARAGESFWQFLPRAWAGSFREGLSAETALRARNSRSRRLHPYIVYVGGAAGCLIAAAITFGLPGLLIWLGLALHAQLQLLLSDYVQHYGLSRRQLGSRFIPVGPEHSWDAPQSFSGLMMLHAPRHADHHLNPSRPYPNLRLHGETPRLPRSLPVMATIALCPPLWHRMMDRRLARCQMQQNPPEAQSSAPSTAM